MQSKRSLFNATLFRKTLARFWPLWGGATAMGMLVPLSMLMTLFANVREGQWTVYHWSRADFANTLFATAFNAAPILNMLFAILVAMAVWGYLYHPRSAGMMHSLPISRTGLFFTNTVTGLAMLLIPYVVIGLTISAVAAMGRCLDLYAVGVVSLSVLLELLLFYGLATLCAMLTGNIFVLPALYGVLNFLAPAASLLVGSLTETLVPGAYSEIPMLALKLSPVSGLDSISVHFESDAGLYRYENMGYLFLSGAVGLVFLAVSWLIYRRRQSESAGNVVAHRILRPFFLYGSAIAASLTAGWLLYEILWGNFFQQSHYADVIPMGIFMVLGGVIGYYAASMLLQKSLRVFRKSGKGVITSAAVVVLCFAAISSDAFGIAGRIPEAEDVRSVTVHLHNTEDYTRIRDLELSDPASIQAVLELNRALTEDAGRIRSVSRLGTRLYELNISYWLTSDGPNYSHRTFVLPLSLENAEKPGTVDQLLRSLYEDPDIQTDSVFLPKGYRIAEVSLWSSDEQLLIKPDKEDVYDPFRLYLDGSDAYEPIIDALLEDAAQGRLYAGDFPDYEDPYSLGMELNITATIWNPMFGGYNTETRCISLTEGMVSTLNALLDHGYITHIPQAPAAVDEALTLMQGTIGGPEAPAAADEAEYPYTAEASGNEETAEEINLDPNSAPNSVSP